MFKFSFQTFEIFLLICCLAFSSIALISSVRASSTASRLSSEVVELQRRMTELQTQIVHLNKSIDSRLEAIDIHLEFIEKYAQSEYYRIYGDVGQITNSPDNSTNAKKLKK